MYPSPEKWNCYLYLYLFRRNKKKNHWNPPPALAFWPPFSLDKALIVTPLFFKEEGQKFVEQVGWRVGGPRIWIKGEPELQFKCKQASFCRVISWAIENALETKANWPAHETERHKETKAQKGGQGHHMKGDKGGRKKTKAQAGRGDKCKET